MVSAKLANTDWLNNHLNAAFTSTPMFGYFTNSLAGGFTGDYLGQRKAFRVNLLTIGASICAATLVPSMYWLISLRCLTETGIGALIMTGYASPTEFILPAVHGKWSVHLSFVGNRAPMLPMVTGVVITVLLSWRVMLLLGGMAMLSAWYPSGRYYIKFPCWLADKGQRSETKKHLMQVESQIEKEKSITSPSCRSECSLVDLSTINGSSWLLFKGSMLRCTLVTITVLIAVNISLYIITIWVPTIFVNSGIDVTKPISMTTIITTDAPVGTFIVALAIDHFPRRLFGPLLLAVITLLGYSYSFQAEEWAVLSYGLVMIFFLYMHVCLVSVVYVPEL